MISVHTLLLGSLALGLFHLFLAVGMATAQRGIAWNASNREKEVAPLTGPARRVELAFENFKETFPFFLAALFAAEISGNVNDQTLLGCQLYFFARLAYLPVYAAGITHLRTLIFVVSIVGICKIAFSAL